MKKACSRCGKIHDRGFVCSAAPVARRESEAASFRNRQAWKKKAADIRRRDMQMCQICVRNLYNSIRKYNGFRLSVHHIIPLAADFERRFDDGNLITLCRYHHELAESGKIPIKQLLQIAAEQEEKR